MVKIPCYENSMLYLKVYLCFNQAQFDEVAKKYKVLDPGCWCKSGVGQTKSITTPSGSRVHVISLEKKGFDKTSLLAALVHECTHVWQWHKEFIGEVADCWEIEAYFIGELFRYFVPFVVGRLK